MLWHQDQWEKWVGGFRENYDLILVEVPSMLAYADAHVLMNHCDGVIMTVRSHQSKKEGIRETKESIGAGEHPFMGRNPAGRIGGS